ncbi:MAG TPA: hypothetical protein VKG62_08210, partial [Solirubrobacteraceae bacterium]|nr:hypothetical protein [Solirubrobacteraceae bacterium]
QSTSVEPAHAGGSSTFTLSFERPEGQQYIGKISDLLPAGLVGNIPTVPLCEEPQAGLGTCTSASQIGTVAVAAGSGSEPYMFSGKAYLTGPYEGAPYGLSIVVPSVAGPFNLGNVIARVKIEVNPYTGQVIATDNNVPTIVGGIPIRLRALTVTINRQGFERNPTYCGGLETSSLLTSTLGATKEVSSPFQAEGCSSLAFTPSFAAKTNGKFSKLNGAFLETTVNQPAGQANIKSVLVTLPSQLPSRLSTLQKACLRATFEANPKNCNVESRVGTARANTPVLPGKLQGTAYLVAVGGSSFPDLDLVLEANGVRVILVGHTKIKNGITTDEFPSSPDVPVTSITVVLPTGPYSALANYGDLCTAKLAMPTTITAQNGKKFTQNTNIGLRECGVRVLAERVVANTAYVIVKSFEAGRITAYGRNLSTVGQSVGGGIKQTTIKVPLSGSGYGASRPFSTRVYVGFRPNNRKNPSSKASIAVTFR